MVTLHPVEGAGLSHSVYSDWAIGCTMLGWNRDGGNSCLPCSKRSDWHWGPPSYSIRNGGFSNVVWWLWWNGYIQYFRWQKHGHSVFSEITWKPEKKTDWKYWNTFQRNKFCDVNLTGSVSDLWQGFCVRWVAEPPCDKIKNSCCEKL